MHFGFGNVGSVFGMFGVFYILFFLVFLAVLGIIIFVLFRNISRERQNDRSPKLTVPAKVVSKRTHFYHSHGKNHVGHGHTHYYATFEVKSGDRMELNMTGNEFGLLVEGDKGELTFQGTRFLRFERKTNY